MRDKKILVCGDGGHGKDEFCESLGVSFISSSRAALDKVIWPSVLRLEGHYASKEACFKDRRNHRDTWFRLISEYNLDDPTRLAREILAENRVYCGMRSRREFYASEEEGLFDITVWVDASDRLPNTRDSSNEILRDYCDIVVFNNGTVLDLKRKAERLGKLLKLGGEI